MLEPPQTYVKKLHVTDQVSPKFIGLAMKATQGATVGWVRSGKGWRPALKVRLALPCLSFVTYSLRTYVNKLYTPRSL